MAETVRAIATLLANLADNTSRAISEENIRDVVETFRPKFGVVSLSIAADTVISGVSSPVGPEGNGFVVIGGTAQTLAMSGDVSSPDEFQLQWDGPAIMNMIAWYWMELSSKTSDGQTIASIVRKTTGSPLILEDSYRRVRNVGTTPDKYLQVSGFSIGTNAMSSGDVVELCVANETSDDDIVVREASFGIALIPN